MDTLRNNTDSVRSSILQRKDSTLNAVKKQQENVDKINLTLSALQQKIRFKMDSVRTSLKPDTAVLTALDRLQSKADSLKRETSNIAAKVNGTGINEQLNKIQGSAASLTGKIQNPVNARIAQFQQNGAQGLPGLDLPTLPVTQLPIETPAIKMPDLSVNGQGLGSTSALPVTDLPQVNQTFSDLPGVNDPTDKLGLSESLKNPVSKISDDLPTDKLQQLKSVSPESLETEVGKLEPLSGINEQFSQADMAKRYFDPDVAKEEGLNRAKLEATNHFAGHEEEIKAAMEMLSNVKAKIPDTEYVVDAFARNKNSIQDSSFLERLVPGFTMQLQIRQSVSVDLNPSLAYKFSNRILAGAGWNERIAFYPDQKEWDNEAHSYGVRAFIHYRLRDFFWVKSDMEWMNINPQKLQNSATEPPNRIWVWAYFVGIKRDFRIARNVSGNVQMLYNLGSTQSQRPYMQKFNVRIGIELTPFRKRKEVTEAKEEETNK